MKKIFFAITLTVFGLFSQQINAQETRVYTSNLRWYNEGLELLEKEKYSAAINAFEKTRSSINDKNSEVYVNATYYKAVCALNLFNKDAEFQLKEFIKNYPESPQVKHAYFQLGKYNYRKKKWEKVIYWFAKTDAFSFSNSELYEYNFRLGYSHFRLENYEKAAPFFHELVDIQTPYYVPANYYYAHIAYLEGNYESAIQGFNKIRSDKKFGVIIPYYITQIYYKQERYDTLISYATPMLDNAKTKRKPEISKLVGDAYFNQKNYAQAIPYLKFYIKEGEQQIPEDYFQLAYAMMQNEEYEDAIKYFSRISAKEDELAQKSIYNMAECYLKADNKPYARNAFFKASKLDYNPAIAEESLLNYAKLSYEIAYDPYTDAIDAFIQYLEKYPNALKKDEAFEYLVNIYLSTNNYRAALASLETTKELDPRLKKVYQQLQFNLAVEQFQNGNYKNAVESFRKSQAQAEDKDLNAQSSYWIAESFYRQKAYKKAIDEYENFIFEPRAFLLPEFKIANYALGYAYYQQKDYKNGAKWFRKYLNYTDASPTRRHDALLRTGDCYFITKSYLLSEEYYKKAFVEGGRNADYALYQYAITQGLLKKKVQQNESLEKLLADFPKSTYAQGALYELGKNYMILNQNDKALANFETVVSGDPNNPYRKRSLENMGLIYYNNNENEKALKTFKQVVAEYPTYAESKSALSQIQSIYKATGNIDEYEAYIGTLAFMNISDGALDSLSYASAEDFYMDHNLDKSIRLFQKYIDRFDNPIFANKAHFYLAESQYQVGELGAALPNYVFNVKSNDPLFFQPSLERAAEISYKLEDYRKSLVYFQQLQQTTINADELNDVHWWAFKSASKIDSHQIVIQEAAFLLQDSLDDVQREAHIKFTLANSYRALNDTNQALSLYREVTTISQEEKSAESLYRIAEILYEQQNIDSSEAIIFELAQHTPTYPKWLANGLILLSDIYVLQEDYFQARTTLESIIANYKGDEEILSSAQSKLDNLTALENSNFDEPESKTEEEVTFDDEENDDLIDDLFDEEELEEEVIPQKPQDNE
ncbi:tetratricopeptide repeat protein [bacterium SCSIO 12643]|nr:tetratricopeptide repeat protein [bacterium SCSIO 12643]